MPAPPSGAAGAGVIPGIPASTCGKPIGADGGGAMGADGTRETGTSTVFRTGLNEEVLYE
jgi:hypothetical protein